MSKYIKTIPLSSIERMAIVLGNGRLAGKVKQDTGADEVINFGFFSGSKPTHHLKIDGKILTKESWECWGYSWDTGPDIKMEAIPASSKRNYIAGLELISPMTKDIGLQYKRSGELGGIRGRTALALKPGHLITYCCNDGKDAVTLDKLQTELLSMGAESAVYGDGGGSSQGAGDGWEVKSSDIPPRAVYSYLCIWLKKEIKEDKPVDKYTVCLDPGHGVETAGKCAPDKSYYEHEFNLDMALRLKALLERHGVEATLTRSTAKDVSLEQRVKTANGIAGLNLFVSLHSNASGDGKDWTAPDGYGIYTSAAGATAGRNIAANKLLSRAKEAGIKLWGGGLFHDGLYVLKNTTAPAILIEHGFHTNRAETELLKSDAYRQNLAEVDCKGILDYLGVEWQDEQATPAPWYAGAQKWAVGAGISDGTRPEAPATRAEVWEMLRNLKGGV